MNFKSILSLSCLFILASAIGAFGQFETFTPLKMKVDKMSAGGNISKGIEFLTGKIEKKDKDLFEAYGLRSELYLIGGDHERSLRDLDLALEIKPDANLYERRSFIKERYLKDPAGALKDLEMAERNGFDKRQAGMRRAGIKRKLKDIDGAMMEYRNLLTSDPNAIQARLQLSDIMFEKDDQEAAITEMDAFLSAIVTARGGKLPKVIGEKWVRKGDSIDLDEYGTRPVISHSLVNYSANSPAQLKEQMAEFDFAKEFANGLVFLGSMRIGKKQRDYDRALLDFEKAIQVNKNQAGAFALRGWIHLQRFEYEKAVSELNEALERANRPYSYIDRGLALAMLGKKEEGQKDFDTAMKLCGECVDAFERRSEKFRKHVLESQKAPAK